MRFPHTRERERQERERDMRAREIGERLTKVTNMVHRLPIGVYCETSKPNLAILPRLTGDEIRNC